jgi:hypothetical protein
VIVLSKSVTSTRGNSDIGWGWQTTRPCAH